MEPDDKQPIESDDGDNGEKQPASESDASNAAAEAEVLEKEQPS